MAVLVLLVQSSNAPLLVVHCPGFCLGTRIGLQWPQRAVCASWTREEGGSRCCLGHTATWRALCFCFTFRWTTMACVRLVLSSFGRLHNDALCSPPSLFVVCAVYLFACSPAAEEVLCHFVRHLPSSDGADSTLPVPHVGGATSTAGVESRRSAQLDQPLVSLSPCTTLRLAQPGISDPIVGLSWVPSLSTGNSSQAQLLSKGTFLIARMGGGLLKYIVAASRRGPQLSSRGWTASHAWNGGSNPTESATEVPTQSSGFVDEVALESCLKHISPCFDAICKLLVSPLTL